MKRPLSSRQDVPAHSVTEALQLAVNFIRSAYVSGFEVLTWTAENLDMPVALKYVGGEFEEEVNKVGDAEQQALHRHTVQRGDTADSREG